MIHKEPPIELATTIICKNENIAQKYTDYCISKGYEGAIFRQFDANYKFGKRQQNMTKLKRLIDEEFIIVDIIPQSVDPSKGNFVCKTKENKRFNVTPHGTDFYKINLLMNKHNYIGKLLTCSFYEWTADKKPLHITTCTIRDYE